MSQYTKACAVVDGLIGRRVEALISEGPDEVVNTWQMMTIETADITKDRGGFGVAAVTLRGRLDDGRLVFGAGAW